MLPHGQYVVNRRYAVDNTPDNPYHSILLLTLKGCPLN
jgi:hypothetical protein